MKVRVGIVGLGWFGNVHLDQLLEMNDVEVAALATHNQEKLEKAHQKIPSARIYLDYHEMLENEELDALYICVIPSRHEDIELLACQKGIAIYVEKPIGLELKQVKYIEEKIIQSGIINSVGYQERYSKGIVRVKQWLLEEELLLAQGTWINQMPEVSWWRNEATSGGQVIEQTTHIYDIFRYLFGEFEVLSAKKKDGLNQVEDYSVDDSSIALLQSDGILVSIYSGCYLKDSPSEIGFTLYGRNSKLEYFWGEQLVITSKDKKEILDFKKDNHHFIASQNFIEAVKEKDQSRIHSSYSDARRTLELTMDVMNKINK